MGCRDGVAAAYGSPWYDPGFLCFMGSGWAFVCLRGLVQCVKEVVRHRKRRRSRDLILAHLPFGVGLAFCLLGACRVAYFFALVGARDRCGERKLRVLRDAVEPLLLVALSSIVSYWWQLADSCVSRIKGTLEGRALYAFLAFNAAFAASSWLAFAAAAFDGDSDLKRLVAFVDLSVAAVLYVSQGGAALACGRALVRRLDASLETRARASEDARRRGTTSLRPSLAAADLKLRRLRARVLILSKVCGLGSLALGGLVAANLNGGGKPGRATFAVDAILLNAVELPVALLAAFLGFRTNYDELEAAANRRSIYELAGKRLSMVGRRLSGIMMARSGDSSTDPQRLGSPQIDGEFFDADASSPRSSSSARRSGAGGLDKAPSVATCVDNPMVARTSVRASAVHGAPLSPRNAACPEAAPRTPPTPAAAARLFRWASSTDEDPDDQPAPAPAGSAPRPPPPSAASEPAGALDGAGGGGAPNGKL